MSKQVRELGKKWFGRLTAVAISALGLFGCAGQDKPVKAPPTGLTSATFKSHWDKPVSGDDEAEGARGAGRDGAGDGSLSTSGLHVSNDIARLCNLPRTGAAPQFDFDSTTIGPDDREVLSALARCLSEGPLRGKRVTLIGRADARGEIEYNMSLGESRADSVRRYLHDLGVAHERVTASSRGELDAVGTDETGYAMDRRVDIALAD